MFTILLRPTALAVGLFAMLAGVLLLPGAGVALAAAGHTPPAAATTPTPTPATPAAGDTQRPPGWTNASHGNKVAPNYDVVFPVDAVNTLTITIAPEDWAAMQEDMEKINPQSVWLREAVMAAGAGLTMEERVALLPKLLRDRATLATTTTPTTTVALTGTGAPTATATLEPITRSPMWVPATIAFQGQEWQHVGVRYKGVSSLNGPWVVGELKLPFKFDFDQFEDDYPEIDNQRFFGFKQLSLANNYEDPAGMRDIVTYELLREAGLPSLGAAPYEIVLDYGEGPVRLGLYTMVEVVDNTGIPTYFGSDDGNMYEGDGRGASLTPQYVEILEDSFEKKNNEEQEDYSDIWALYDLLHDPERTTDPAAWRARLEAIFDVDGFLAWLGVAALIGHVDTYGGGAHNFYLYHDPATDRLTWFSWDHNMSFHERYLGSNSIGKAEVTDAWPLIRYLLDDPVYWQRYVGFLSENFAGALDPAAVAAKIEEHAKTIAPFATLDMSAEEYDAAVQEMLDFVDKRAAEAAAFLAEQE